MKICFPADALRGLESQVFGHFGSAPGFVIVDAETLQVEEIANEDLHHAHGMCQPLAALGGRKVDGVVVGGIGMGALTKLRTQGVQVYRGLQGTVRDNLDLIRAGRLPQFSSEHACGGHGPGGCGHH